MCTKGNGNFTFNGQYSGSGPGGGSVIGDQNLDFLKGTLSAFEQSKQQQNALRGPIPSLYIQDTYHASTRLTLVGGLRWGPNFMPHDYFNRGLVFNQADFLRRTSQARFTPTPQQESCTTGIRAFPRQFTKNSCVAVLSQRGRIVRSHRQRQNRDSRWRGVGLRQSQLLHRSAQPAEPALRHCHRQPSDIDLGSIELQRSVVHRSDHNQSLPAARNPRSDADVRASSPSTSSCPPQFHPAYTIQWTLSVQRQFGRGWQAQIDYIGNTTRHNPIGFGVSPAVFIPGVWGAGGTGCTGIVRTGPAAVTPGAAGTRLLHHQEPGFAVPAHDRRTQDQGNQFKGGGGGSVLVG